MRILTEKRCIIGEAPIWNEREGRLYFTNGGGNEICIYDPETDTVNARPLSFGVSAFAFDTEGRTIVSHAGGVHLLRADGLLSPIYDENKYRIRYANDMKVGPDGAIYVGTQSGRRAGISEEIDGKLYRITASGEVGVLLDGLILSNGMEWSIDETKFYHTDSDTHTVREYHFDRASGSIDFTGRQIGIDGVDGFTVGSDGCLYVGCWGWGYIAVVDTRTLKTVEHIRVPCQIPTSCGFFGKDMDCLAVTTASYHTDVAQDGNAGFTLLKKMGIAGRKPYLFGAAEEAL